MTCKHSECKLKNDEDLPEDAKDKINAGICPYPDDCICSTEFGKGQ